MFSLECKELQKFFPNVLNNVKDFMESTIIAHGKCEYSQTRVCRISSDQAKYSELCEVRLTLKSVRFKQKVFRVNKLRSISHSYRIKNDKLIKSKILERYLIKVATDRFDLI